MRIPGLIYPVCLPNGHWVGLMSGQYLLTPSGTVDLPGFDVLELDVHSLAGGYQIAGKAQQEPTSIHRGTWEWSGLWRHISLEAHGTYSAIYDNFGALHLGTPELTGSQGWRYVREDGELITGDQTYNPARWAEAGFSPVPDALWEFSYLGGVFFGQGDNPQGCHVLIDGERRLLLEGDCRFIRVKCDGTRWGVGVTRLREGDGHVFPGLTRADLKALPLITTTPTPTPEPEPEPTPMPDISDQTPVVASVRAHYPTPLGNQHAACLLEIARTIGQGAGLLRKDTGSNILLPDGTRVAQDIIVFPDGQGFDCLGSGETLATPQWSGPVEGSPFPANRYYAVSSTPEPEPEPGPTPEPPPSGDVQRLILAELQKLNAKLDRVFR